MSAQRQAHQLYVCSGSQSKESTQLTTTKV